MAGRRTVSYFEPQFDSMVVSDPGKFFEVRGAEQMVDIKQRGFDEVVLCVTELDMQTIARRQLVSDLTRSAKEQGLLVTADAWNVGGVFGGEGMSLYEQNGGKRCVCEPKLNDLLLKWLDTIAELGITRVFWDEPELSCPEHDLSLELIDHFSQQAVKRGISWNASCIRSRDPSVDVSDSVASMTAINEIAVAPYPFHPFNTPTQRTDEEVIETVASWFRRIKVSADKHGVDAQAWLQGFNISPKDLPFLSKYVNEIKRAEIENIAVWGYRSCASVRDLNPDRAESPEIVWEEVCRVMGEFIV